MSAQISVCVFCGARPGNNPAYLQAARDVGQAIADEGWRLVYGSGDKGVMGEVANTVRDAAGEVLGVIPTHLLGYESNGPAIGSRVITGTMHERKKVMFLNSDAIVLLPGGAGSLDEFFEGLTWSQLGIHEKPIFVLDVNGYWQPLLSLVDHLIAEGFADESLKDLFQVKSDTGTLVEALRALRSSLTETQL